MKNSITRLIFLIALAGTLSACQSDGRIPVDPNTPVAAGSVRTNIKSPDVSKWQVVSRTANGLVYNCRQLACSDGVMVTGESERAPTSKPDPEALKKLAAGKPTKSTVGTELKGVGGTVTKEDKIDGHVTTIKGYPTVSVAFRVETDNKVTIYTVRHAIFAKSALIKLTAVSVSRAAAEKALREFEGALEITEGAAN